MIIPKKHIKLYPNNKPWITSTLRNQVIDKHRAFSNCDPQYLQKQANLDDAITKAKVQYKDKVEKMFSNNNMKDAWRGLRNLTGQSETKKSYSITSTPGSADRLNSFYSRFDTTDFSENHDKIRNKLNLKIVNENEIVISEPEIVKVFIAISRSKASGPDNVSAKILKKCSRSLLYIVHSIFNMSINSCKMPSIWKIGEIIPVSKKTLPTVDNDLRPVTLTAVMSKCFERCVLPLISNCTKPHMDNLQFAYQTERSTEDALTYVIHILCQHLDQGSNYARCLFIDYSSAFNTMQPHVLIDKLDVYNVPARLQLFVLDFLTNRKQYVKTSSECSSITCINTGAPQGCVLSAFLFIVYTNSLAINSKQCKIVKYADDTIVVGLIDNNDETQYRNTISYVSNWCTKNFLDLNVSKTKEMIFDPRKKQNAKDNVIINCSTVETVHSYKYLGVTIQDNLKWDQHVNIQVKKANKRMYHVRCLRKLKVDNKLLCLFYNSVISSVLVYAISSWFNACNVKLQNNVTKFSRKLYKMSDSNCHHLIENPSTVCNIRCLNLISKILNPKS